MHWRLHITSLSEACNFSALHSTFVVRGWRRCFDIINIDLDLLQELLAFLFFTPHQRRDFCLRGEWTVLRDSNVNISRTLVERRVKHTLIFGTTRMLSLYAFGKRDRRFPTQICRNHSGPLSTLPRVTPRAMHR
jgi:hypothetical protein